MKKLNLAALVLTMAFFGCSNKKNDIQKLSDIVPMPKDSQSAYVQPEARLDPPRYFYPYSAKRDPFMPLLGNQARTRSGEGGQGLSGGELSNLELKGILRDRRGKVAIIAASDGEPFILRAGRIYDQKNRIVSGVSCIIKENSVIIISQNRAMTELSLRKKDEAGISMGTQ